MNVFSKAQKFVKLSEELRKIKNVMNEGQSLEGGFARTRDFQRVSVAKKDYTTTLRKIEDLALQKH
jgi:hypothetical protein